MMKLTLGWGSGRLLRQVRISTKASNRNPRDQLMGARRFLALTGMSKTATFVFFHWDHWYTSSFTYFHHVIGLCFPFPFEISHSHMTCFGQWRAIWSDISSRQKLCGPVCNYYISFFSPLVIEKVRGKIDLLSARSQSDYSKPEPTLHHDPLWCTGNKTQTSVALIPWDLRVVCYHNINQTIQPDMVPKPYWTPDTIELEKADSMFQSILKWTLDDQDISRNKEAICLYSSDNIHAFRSRTGVRSFWLKE